MDYFASNMAKASKPLRGKRKPKADELKKMGARIRSLRRERGYTNYENFAFEKDLPRAQYGRYERGEDLRFSSLVKICKALDISLKEFFSKGFE